jgi:signal transduction histidine kinase
MKEKDYYAGIVHDAISTLNGISGLLEIVIEETDLPEKKENLRYLKMAHEGTRGLINRLQQVMTISRLEGGVVEIKKTKFDLFPLTEKIISSFRAEFRNESIKFTRGIVSGSSHFDCLGDEDLIARALNNLLRNAVEEVLSRKYQGEDCIINIQFGNNTNGETIIEVLNKSEILPGNLENLFTEKFTTKANGHGLGTQIVQAVAKAHGGFAFAEKEGEMLKIGIKIPNH